jgi:GAF domain-containing protein/HAMP domain-containing protein
MIDRFLRRLPVRQRIVGAFLILVVLLALSVPLIVANQSFLLSRLRQITDVETRADRLLLLASARIESSRVNLMRYIQDYAPSAYEALDDVDQATQLLAEAQGLIESPEQQEVLDTILAALGDYTQLVRDVEAARSAGRGQDVSSILFQAYRLGNDIGQRIEQIVDQSEARVAAANEAIYSEAQNRLLILGAIYAGMILLALILAFLIQRSITRPVADLRSGAEAFSQGQMEVTIPVVGTDELSLLAQTFNGMADQLNDLITTLEQRVADRTRDLEQRAVQLATAADVGRAAASILDLETLTQEVVDLVLQRFDLYYAALFLVGEDRRYAILQAGTGEAGLIMKEQGHRLEVGGISMVGTACDQRQARIALDVGEEPVRFDNPLLPYTRSEMALPLILGNRVLGALDVQSTEPGAFTEEDIAVLQLVADQVAVAIGNARLFAEVETSLEAERRAYGEVSRRGWEQLAGTRPVLGYRSDEVDVRPVTEALAPQERARQDRAGELIMPIKVREQVIGLIDASKPDGSGQWTQEEVAVLETLVERLAVALDSARLYEEVQRRADRDRLLGQVAGRIRETLDVETVLKTAVSEARAVLGLPEVTVRLRRDLSSPGEDGRNGMDQG